MKWCCGRSEGGGHKLALIATGSMGPYEGRTHVPLFYKFLAPDSCAFNGPWDRYPQILGKWTLSIRHDSSSPLPIEHVQQVSLFL